MIEMINGHKQLTRDEIVQFEVESKIKFPEKFNQFLLLHNGGSPVPDLFDIVDEPGDSVINNFLAINGAEYDDLATYVEIYDGRLPQGFVPIAFDVNGNLVILGTSGDYADRIYFWDHEQESDTPDDMSNMYRLADTIDGFLDMLYADE